MTEGGKFFELRRTQAKANEDRVKEHICICERISNLMLEVQKALDKGMTF